MNVLLQQQMNWTDSN